jgi:hypothetical protein
LDIFGIAALEVKKSRHEKRSWIGSGRKSVGNDGDGWTENGTFPGRFYIGGVDSLEGNGMWGFLVAR